MYQTLLWEKSRGVATITMNRPESLNSINRQMVYDLGDALGRIKKEQDIRCIVMTGAGRGFCAGADLASGVVSSPEELTRGLREEYNPLIESLTTLDRPVIAAVNGVAAGAGCSMALACDLVIAAESAVFIQGFVRVGLVPDAGASYFLPRLVGPRKAMELALLGEKVTAREAERLGMINRAVPDDAFRAEVDTLARRLSGGPSCQWMIKEMFNRSLEMDLRSCLDMEAGFQGRAAATEDCLEGVMAFLQKRKAIFKGH